MQMLSHDLLESLFARLVVTWGKAFTAQYEGIDPEVVKADWAEKLAGFEARSLMPDEVPQAPAIEWALESLPPKPMNALEFRQLCRQYTPPTRLALDRTPRPLPDRYRAAIQRLAAPLNDPRPEKVRWAERYLAKFGERRHMSPMQRENLVHAATIMAAWERDLSAEARKQRQVEEGATT